MRKCLLLIPLILLVSILLFLTSCDTTSPEEFDEQAILDILDSIQSNFNMDDLDGIMQNYHLDFNHNGDSFDWERTIWEIRLNEFDILNFNNIEINLYGNYATVSFIMHLDDTITDEPSDDNGDISYFHRDFDGWKLCGTSFVVLP